ncbi:hypothetical protein EB796_024649 [Bugula neritina]|uniref:Uncharacterized protein n=1 Tax=Bugula neritina TaxID=10212 RepID=A0A7J7IT05_BUGNE|nr:hypothetical protein EB796_024649 [Bugula neritina]
MTKAIEIEAQSNWEYLDLLKINDSRVILDPLTIEDWSEERDSISMWPKVLFSDLFMYVNEANTALRKSLCILGGWLAYFTTVCRPSERISVTPYSVWIACLQITGKILSAWCSCTAGKRQELCSNA